ncbi:hypothetical protein K504DRAFT_448592 [Pleomassaria siparia CBS 279.74]|uniref:Uncharacterized protein n=1 Tax=Pleomassaria siparia CBS 279.74 TaxID=1314801 RepID=A0A6G1JZ94_9PLEO|nr:hypothetical protein K504DRAFT_448592 [Pleomassaria siparia CBS 279.74]
MSQIYFAAAVAVFIRELRGLTARSTAYRDKADRSNLLHGIAMTMLQVLNSAKHNKTRIKSKKDCRANVQASNYFYLHLPTISLTTSIYYKSIYISLSTSTYFTNAFIAGNSRCLRAYSNTKFIVTYALI